MTDQNAESGVLSTGLHAMREVCDRNQASSPPSVGRFRAWRLRRKAERAEWREFQRTHWWDEYGARWLPNVPAQNDGSVSESE